MPALRTSVARFGVSWRKGVPFRVERWFIAYCPVRIEAREGPQGLTTEKCRRNDTASAISARRCGRFT